MGDMANEFGLIAILLVVLLIASLVSYACLTRCTDFDKEDVENLGLEDAMEGKR